MKLHETMQRFENHLVSPLPQLDATNTPRTGRETEVLELILEGKKQDSNRLLT